MEVIVFHPTSPGVSSCAIEGCSKPAREFSTGSAQRVPAENSVRGQDVKTRAGRVMAQIIEIAATAGGGIRPGHRRVDAPQSLPGQGFDRLWSASR